MNLTIQKASKHIYILTVLNMYSEVCNLVMSSLKSYIQGKHRHEGVTAQWTL